MKPKNLKNIRKLRDSDKIPLGSGTQKVHLPDVNKLKSKKDKMLLDIEKKKDELTHKIMLISRIVEEGYEQTLDVSFGNDLLFVEQFKSFSGEQLDEELEKLESEMTKLSL